MTDIATLVAEHQQIRQHLDVQEETFKKYKEPYAKRLEELQAQISATMTQQGIKSFKTDTGTAILSTIVSPRLLDKTKFLDWVLDDWDNRGAMLQIGTPLKETITEFMDANNGNLPPFVETSSMVRFSIRKA